MAVQQEDLLEKFIQNEKKSKFWALLGAVAFTLVSVTVVYVAKEVKGTTAASRAETVYKTDTVLLTENDPKLNEQINSLRDSLENVLEQSKKDQIAFEELKQYYDECRAGFRAVDDEVKRLEDELKKCEGKPVPPPPAIEQVSIFIKYDAQVPDTTVSKLEKLLRQNKSGKVYMISSEKMKTGLKPVVMYFNGEDEKIANNISSLLNNTSFFRTKSFYQAYLNTNRKMPPGVFEIMLSNIQ